MLCPSCLLDHPDSELIVTTVRIADGRIQLRGSCPLSQVFVKWLPQSAPDQPKEIFFGKYKGKTYDDVAQEDPSYLQWLMGKTEIEKIRKYAQEALTRASA